MSNTTTDVIAERSSASSAADNRGTVVNPIKALQAFGQSVWLDYLRRSLFTSGEFRRLIAEDGLRGVTSNPSIFEKAIAGSTDYLNALQEIERRHDLEPMALVRGAGDSRHPRRGRPSAPGVRGHRARRRLREPGSLAVSRTRHRTPRSKRPAACGRPSIATT